mgnify:CR=1 FL=1|jgi:hypothetical protein
MAKKQAKPTPTVQELQQLATEGLRLFPAQSTRSVWIAKLNNQILPVDPQPTAAEIRRITAIKYCSRYAYSQYGNAATQFNQILTDIQKVYKFYRGAQFRDAFEKAGLLTYHEVVL